MNEMTTVSRVITVLKERGYTQDLELNENFLSITGSEHKLYPSDFVVDKHYRFEGISNPDDQAIVYAICAEAQGIKGILVDNYGPESTPISPEMIQALKDTSMLEAQQAAEQSPGQSQEKSNQATPLRPEGDRVLDGPLIELNLQELIRQIKSEQTWQQGDRNSITISKSPGLRLVLIGLHSGAELKTHTAPGPISVQPLEGKIRFVTEQSISTLTPGQMITLHKQIPHSVYAEQESVFLLTLSTPG